MTLRHGGRALAGWLLVAGGALVASAPAQDDRTLGARVQDALDRSRPHLLQAARRSAGGELALVCLALVDDGVPRDDAVFRGAIRRLAKQRLRGTYDQALRLMVMAELEDYPDRARAARRDAHGLLHNQVEQGGFGYSSRGSRWDMSNTQYGALGLRAAVALGVDVPQAAWRGLLHAAQRAQTGGGGFGYTPGPRSRAYLSMTVAGIAVLELCQQHLRGKSVPVEKIGKRISKAWSWMDHHARQIGTDLGAHTYYAHYGLERAGILSGVTRVGGEDWYRRGAEMMLADQHDDGRWTRFVLQPGTPATVQDPQTQAFAVLFLRRQFKRTLVPVTLGGGLLTRGLPEQASDEQVTRAVELDVARGLSAVPDLLKALRHAFVSRRKAATLALHEITGEDFGLEPYRDPSECGEAIKKAELWWMHHRPPAGAGGR